MRQVFCSVNDMMGSVYGGVGVEVCSNGVVAHVEG